MKVEEKQVTLKKLVASEGKIIVSKEKNEDGEYVVKSKEVYLGNVDSEENYEEIEDVATEEKNEEISEPIDVVERED